MNAIREMVVSDFSHATYVENFRLLDDGSLVKRNGCTYLARFDEPIRGTIHDTDKRVFIVAGNTLCYYEDDFLHYHTYLLGMNFTDEREKCRMFILDDTLYIFGGGSLCTVKLDTLMLGFDAGYVPKLSDAESQHSLNLWKNRVHEAFSVDSTPTYQLKYAASGIFSVKIGGVRLSSDKYSYACDDSGKCSVSINDSSLLVTGSTLDVEYAVGDKEYLTHRSRFLDCNKSYVYEGKKENYLMLYNPNLGYVYYSKSRTDENGEQIFGDYFPLENRFLIENGRGRVRAITRFHNKTVALTQKGMYYITAEEDANSDKTEFRAVLIDDQIGISVSSGIQVFENAMYFINSLGLHKITYSSVDDKYVKTRIEAPESMKLSQKELESATLHVDLIHREIWCITDEKIVVYNPASRKWYLFTGFYPKSCTLSENYTVFYTGNDFCKFDPNASNDFGSEFEASFQTDNIDFGNIFSKKTVYDFGVSFERSDGVVLDCMLISDVGDTFSFSVSSDDDIGNYSPVVKRTHVKLGRCSYVICRVTSRAGVASANIRSLMLRYRIID